MLMVLFCDWVISLRMIPSGSIHFPRNFMNVFIRAEQYSIVYMYHNFYNHSAVEGHLGPFQFMAIVKQASMKNFEHVFLLYVGDSFGYMPRSGIAGSSGSTKSSFLRNCQTDFQISCTSLQFYQHWRSVPLSPHSRQYLLSPEFFILAILTNARQTLQGCFDLNFPDD